jgi:hypothetical protein
VPQEPQLLGRTAMTGRALRLQVQCVSLALMVRWAASAGEGPGEPLGTGLRQSSDHNAGVDALLTAFHLDHDAARAHPRPGLGARRVKAGALGPRSTAAPRERPSGGHRASSGG